MSHTLESPPPPIPSPLHIAIIGASISGLALAIGLTTHAPNITHTIYESSLVLATPGAGIAFGPNALHAMTLLDPRFRAAYDAIAIGNASLGKEHVFHDILLCEDGFGTSKGWEGASVAEIMCGRRAVGIERLVEGGVAVRFADGGAVVVDAVVGCDSGRSVIRKAVLGGACVGDASVSGRGGGGLWDASYVGRYVYRAVVPMVDAMKILGEYAGDGKMFVGEGRYFASYQMAGGMQLNMVARRQDDHPWNHDQWTKEVSREEMLKDFEGCDPRLMQLLDYAKPTRWSLHHHLNTPTYFNKLVCLLGDAAHASTPHQGAGAGQCLEDAVVLSQLLSLISCTRDTRINISLQPQLHLQDHTVNIRHAFQAYDCIRRPRAQKVVQTSDEAGKMYCFADSECGSDVEKIVANARDRFGWIWECDLWEEVQKAEREFKELRAQYRRS